MKKIIFVLLILTAGFIYAQSMHQVKNVTRKYKIDSVVWHDGKEHYRLYLHFPGQSTKKYSTDSIRYEDKSERSFGEIYFAILPGGDIILVGQYGAIKNYCETYGLVMIEVGRFNIKPGTISPVWCLIDQKKYLK